MYEWDDIVIVGDSWCSERDSLGHWPNSLLFELTDITKGTPRGGGFRGCHWWSTRNCLFNELKLKPAKVVIIVHTQASRIPSDTNRPFTLNNVYTQARLLKIKNPENRTIYQAAADYYKHLYSANFHDWAERQWFIELDDFLEKKKIEKVIHLYGVSKHTEQKRKFNCGVTVNHSIHQYLTMNTENMFYPNHMTYENNQKMALFLHKLIIDYPGHGYLYEERPFDK